MSDSMTIERGQLDVGEVRLFYRRVGRGEPLLLLHGFPETSRQWQGIMPALAERFTVLAPDYRGAGHSSRPPSGYDKATLARDLHGLVRQLGYGRINIVGHDIGAMVAYAYAAQFADDVARLVLMDSVIPGTVAFARILANPRVWHFGFHGARDLAERLVEGRERDYLGAFFKARLHDPEAIDEAEIEVYARAYAQPGAMRAAFELYRAFAQDAADNEVLLTVKLPMPVLVLGGEHSTSCPYLAGMAQELAAAATIATVPRSGHWLAQENPAFVTERLLEFL